MAVEDASPAAMLAIRPLDLRLIPAAVRLHRAELPPSFFSRLGPGFLRRYHESFVRSPHGVGLAAVDRSGDLVGFLVGTLDDAAHYRWAIRSLGGRLLTTAGMALVRRPRLASQFARTRLRRYVRGAARLAAAPPSPSSARGGAASLTHVAVAPRVRGRGIGQALARSFLEQATSGGAARLQAKTLAGPGGAGGFYEALGWSRTGQRPDVDGRMHDVYQLEL